MKKLTLKQEQVAENKWQYRVLGVVNHIKPKIGAVLTEAEASRFCRDQKWNVNIIGE